MKLKRNKVETWLATALAPSLTTAGFIWQAPLHQFRRKTTTGFDCVILSVTDFVDTHLAEAHLGIRIDKVEERVFPHLNGAPGFRTDSMTLVTPLGRLFGKRNERLPVAGQLEAERAAAQFDRQLQERGLDFLERHTSIDALDRLYNDDPTTPVPLLHNPVHRCFRGLALAQLNNRPDLSLLYATYQEELKNTYAADWALPAFAALWQQLLGYTLN